MRGDGSVYEEKDPRGGKRWVAQLAVEGRKAPVKRRLSEVTDAKGDLRKATKKDAEKLLKEMRRLAARGELIKKKTEAAAVKLPTVVEVLNHWLAEGCPSGRTRRPAPRTIRCYRGLARNSVAPFALGAMRVDAVHDGHVDALFRELAENGLSSETLTKLRGILGRAFRLAKKDNRWREGLASWTNPVAEVDMPETKPTTKRRKLTVDEIRKLFAATADHRFAGTWVRLGIDCCARPSELSALRWSDLDLTADKPTVTLHRSIEWERDDNNRPLALLGATKTGEAGHRTVTLSPSTVAALRAHWKRQAAERQAAAELNLPGWDDEHDGIDLTDLVFHTETGQLINVPVIAYALAKASKAAGIGHVTPYLTRHAGAELIKKHFGPVGPLVADAALGHKPQGVSPALGAYVTFGGVVDSTCLDAVLEAAEEADEEPGAGLSAVAQ